MVDGYYEFKYHNNKHIFFSGNLESDKYFDNIRDELLEEFSPKHDMIPENKELYDTIFNTNSVCISIRRGDFLNPEFSKKHFICDKEYFVNAVKKMNELIENPQYIIFSDDIEWCKKNIDFIENAKFESGNDPVWEKLRLMYSCKHFIISNSSFSWWTQYLSRNKDKVVIAPKKWKNIGVFDDIYQKNWTLL